MTSAVDEQRVRDGADDDSPRCPACAYSLVALASPRCPECGAELGDDLERHRPSRTVTPWSAATPLPLWRGLWQMLRRPVATLAACADPRRVTLRRAAMFAALCLLTFLVIWGPLREFIQAVHVYIRDRGDTSIRDLADQLAHELPQVRRRWVLPSVWLAWAQARWMLLFALLALALPGPASALRPRASHRLTGVLLMTPWLLLLDLMCSMTIWAAVGSCVPEPSSMFPLSLIEPFNVPEVARIWFVRLIVPVPMVATIFFRGVLRWRWSTALLGGVVLIGPAALLWMACDDLFLWSEVYELAG